MPTFFSSVYIACPKLCACAHTTALYMAPGYGMQEDYGKAYLLSITDKWGFHQSGRWMARITTILNGSQKQALTANCQCTQDIERVHWAESSADIGSKRQTNANACFAVQNTKRGRKK